jgi:hypothetical protein
MCFTETRYCIRGLSETTGASSDVYCQSNNDNNIQTSCTFYEESIQVKHERGIRQRVRKEGMRYCGLGREGENVSGEREREQHGF